MLKQINTPFQLGVKLTEGTLNLLIQTTDKDNKHKWPDPFKFLCRLIRFPLSLLFFRLTSPSSLSLSSYIICFSPLIIFVTPCCTLSSISMVLVNCEAQNWTPDSRCVLSNAEQRRICTDNFMIKCFGQSNGLGAYVTTSRVQ